MNRIVLSVWWSVACAAVQIPTVAEEPVLAEPLPVKVVIVALYEQGEVTGDAPGEFQYWVERMPLDLEYPFPAGIRPLRGNAEGVLGMVAGVGTARAASSTMALGLDGRFDLTRAYWLIVGIAGVDPEDASLASAAWAEWVVDGDLGYLIDMREMPDGWPTGYIPFNRGEPYETPVPDNPRGSVFHLKPTLVDWAYQLTKDIELEDTEAMRDLRSRYVGHPNAQRPPFVLKGDNLDAMTFWHGKLMNEWANQWVRYWTRGKGNFVTTAMEDTGICTALTLLAQAQKVDLDRVLVLRTASNYSMQFPGISAAENLQREAGDEFTANRPALESAWRVGSRVVEEIVHNWDRLKHQVP